MTFDHTLEIIRIILENFAFRARSQIPKSGPDADINYADNNCSSSKKCGLFWSCSDFTTKYCKRGNIRGTLIFADFAVFQQAQIQKPAKIFAIFSMHILDT